MAISFKGAHFPKEVILMGVRWYVAYPVQSKYSNSPLCWRLHSYQCPRFGLFSAPSSPILSVKRGGKR